MLKLKAAVQKNWYFVNKHAHLTAARYYETLQVSKSYINLRTFQLTGP